MSHLKLGLSLVLLTSYSVLSDKYEEIKAECGKEHKFSEENMGDISDPAFSHEAKCALACLFEKYDVFKKDGSIDIAKEKEMTEEGVKNEDLKKKFLKAIDECDTSAKADKCETAYEFVKCKTKKVALM
ncbi:uncharacterized protein [Halyomorpha halys]|uniref:uncharacterized protein isoform X1 n=1 Tax=Halyomorpha halys TaxID=286706 RepID=UPI0006D4D423|nr:uncharacterized protein LOC106688328 isoform X1 [Halyomorpha halys]KAE8573081.1 Odorant-binding protein 44 [Halyomorpha halys]